MDMRFLRWLSIKNSHQIYDEDFQTYIRGEKAQPLGLSSNEAPSGRHLYTKKPLTFCEGFFKRPEALAELAKQRRRPDLCEQRRTYKKQQSLSFQTGFELKKGDDILSHITAVLPTLRDAGGLNFSVRDGFEIKRRTAGGCQVFAIYRKQKTPHFL